MKYLMFLTFFLSPLTHAADLAHFNHTTSVTSTRDHFSLREYSFKWMNHRRYPGWEYSGEEKSAFDWGIQTTIRNGSAGTSQYKGAKVEAIAGMKWSQKSSTYLSLGVHELDNRSRSLTHITAPFSLTHNQGVGKWLNSSISLVSDWNYQELQLSGAVENFTRKQTVHHSFLITPVNNLRINLRGRNSEYSDDNSSYHQDFDIKYKVGPKESWILVGAGAEYTRFEKFKTDYWTPRRFISMGPRFEIVQSFAKKFQASLATNLNRFQDENSTWGDGFYSNFSLQYGKREQTNLKLGYERIQSSQSGSLWYSDRLYLSFNHFH